MIGLLLSLPLFWAVPGQPDLVDALAARAVARIRPGESLAAREEASNLLIGLGAAADRHVKVLAASKDVIERIAALKILGSRPREAAFFVPFLEDASYSVRTAALEGIQNALDGSAVRESVLPLLNDPAWPVRCAALGALAAWPGPGTAVLFLKALRDPDARVRGTALRFLDEAAEEVPEEPLTEAALYLASVDAPAFRDFLKAGPSFAGPSNLSFFLDLAETRAFETEGVLALFAYSSVTRTYSPEWTPRLLDRALTGDKDGASAAETLLTLHRERIPPAVRKRLTQPGDAAPAIAVYLLGSLLRDEAFHLLGEWALDDTLPEAARIACITGLSRGGSKEGMRILVAVYPDLKGALKTHALRQAALLAQERGGAVVKPLLVQALAEGDGEARSKAFQSLCLLDDPPVDLLIAAFRSEADTALRDTFGKNLSNAAHGDGKRKIMEAFCTEVLEQGPAGVTAALELPPLADPACATRVGTCLKGLLEEEQDPGREEIFLHVLMALDDPEADGVAARTLERARERGRPLDEKYLARQLAEVEGPKTAKFLKRLYLEGEEDLRLEAFRALLRRGDPFAAERMGEVLATARASYGRSILEALPESGLAGRCADLLAAILGQEKNPDLLAPALDAAPLSLLRSDEEQLLKLADLGAALGLDGVDALFRAFCRTESPRGIDFMKMKVEEYLSGAEESVPDLARMAVLSLAEIKDEEAPSLLLRMIFFQAHALEKRSAVSPERVFRAPEWTQLVSALLAFDDGVVDETLNAELDALRKSGALFKMGDVVFYDLFHALDDQDRCADAAARLASLTLRCAPCFSFSDFRLLLDTLPGDREGRAGALVDAYRILKFHPPPENVIKERLGSADPFNGYDPVNAFAREMHLALAYVLEGKGRSDEAAAERERARRRAPFLVE